MPLVDFTPEALQNGYKADVDTFNNAFTLLNHHQSFEKSIDNLETAKVNIDNILVELKSVIKLPQKSMDEIESSEPNYIWDHFEYSRDVPALIKKEGNYYLANTLWGLRHALCYQLLIYTYYKSQTTEFTTTELNLFKLGIFGSVTPTSDIDIGFQYSKKNDRKVGIIAHVVKTFEDAFLDLTNKYSLAYDIEPYADMMYLDDTDGGLFYCDSTDFDGGDLLTIMPAIGASIIRNVVQTSIDIDSAYEDVRKHKPKIQSGGNISKITNMINTFKFDTINTYFEQLVSDMSSNRSTIDNISNTLKTTSWNEEAQQLAKAYMTKPYDVSRQDYYNKVILAETTLSQFPLGRDDKIPKANRVKLMKQIAEALVFRAESYVSPSTVMHVVRVMQAKEAAPSNGETCEKLRLKKSKAQCALGKYGYIMSCIEQIGYLYRFDKTYCDGLIYGTNTENTHQDDEKCYKKKQKYYTRLEDGINRLSAIYASRTSSIARYGSSTRPVGGKRRKYSKKLHKQHKTQKHKNISKQTKRKNMHSRRRTNKRVRK